MSGRRAVVALLSLLLLAGCGSPADGDAHAKTGAPTSFRIVPDDYHVPYAGTAADGRKFFLSEELFEGDTAYVGLFLWHADGSFDEVRVDPVPQPAAADDLVHARLAELGDYVLEPIEVEPFTEDVDGVTFGWRTQEYDGVWSVNVTPGDFIAYYEPWDGLDYDT